MPPRKRRKENPLQSEGGSPEPPKNWGKENSAHWDMRLPKNCRKENSTRRVWVNTLTMVRILKGKNLRGTTAIDKNFSHICCTEEILGLTKFSDGGGQGGSKRKTTQKSVR